LDKSFDFGLPGDWIVEIPGCDDFFLLREIPSLPGAYRIASICGLAIAVDWAGEWLPDGELAPPTTGSVLPRYRNDELISRLVVFDRHQLQFLRNLEILVPPGTTLGQLSGKPDPSMAESFVSLSDQDTTQYIQWADRIRDNPLRATQPTSFEDTLKNVSTYLDRWQDLDLWDRIISEYEAVPWPNILEALAEVRTGFLGERPPDERIAGIIHDQSLPACQILRIMITKLEDLLLGLTRRWIYMKPASMMDAFGPLLQALDEADTSTFLEMFKPKEDEIRRNLKELESHLEFMRDSLPKCYAIRDKFAQRQLLKHLYRRSEPRSFLIY
jgi:hypothetical protein